MGYYQNILIKRVYDYLEVESRKRIYKSALAFEIESLREFLRLYEDGLSWEEIKNHLKFGCDCKEIKGKEAKKALQKDLS